MSVIGIILCVLVGIYLAITCVIFGLFWYEKGINPCPELKQPKRGFFTVVRLWLCFTGAELMRLYSIVHWAIRQKKTPNQFQTAKNLGRPVIVLVHGLYDRPSSWLVAVHYLEKAGYRVVTFGYKSLKGTHETVGKAFDDFMSLAGVSFPEQKFLLIGHSLGGLIVRNWLAQPGNEEKASGLVTIGTPHKGSRLALFAPGSLSRCLMPNSAFIQSLEAAPALTIPCIAVVSCEDEMVLPGANLLPPEGWTIVEVNRGGHLAQIFCPCTIKRIIKEIAVFSGIDKVVVVPEQAAPQEEAAPENTEETKAEAPAKAPTKGKK